MKGPKPEASGATLPDQEARSCGGIEAIQAQPRPDDDVEKPPLREARLREEDA